MASHRIFICYRRGDTADITGRLYDRLELAFGKGRVFKDVFSIGLGRNFREVIEAELRQTGVLLVVMGDHWNTERLQNAQDSVRCEIEQALAQGICVIPLFVRGMKMPAAVELPESMKRFVDLNGMPLRDDPDFDRDLERLTKTLSAELAQPPESVMLPMPPHPPRAVDTPELPADTRGWLLALVLGCTATAIAVLAVGHLDLDRAIGQALLSSGCASVVWGALRRLGGERWLPGGAPMACMLALVGGLLCTPIWLL